MNLENLLKKKYDEVKWSQKQASDKRNLTSDALKILEILSGNDTTKMLIEKSLRKKVHKKKKVLIII